MFGLGFQELTVILVIILVLFGGKKVPELSRSMAEAIRELRRGFTSDEETSSGKKAEGTKQSSQ